MKHGRIVVYFVFIYNFSSCKVIQFRTEAPSRYMHIFHSLSLLSGRDEHKGKGREIQIGMCC